MVVYCFCAGEDHTVYAWGVCSDSKLADYCCSGKSLSGYSAKNCSDSLPTPERFASTFGHSYSSVESFDYDRARLNYLACYYYLLQQREKRNTVTVC